MCKRSFLFKGSFEKHVSIVHEGLKPFQCNICDKKYKDKASVLRHESLPHAYQCEDCDKKYIREMHLKRHMSLAHEGGKLHI